MLLEQLDVKKYNNQKCNIILIDRSSDTIETSENRFVMNNVGFDLYLKGVSFTLPINDLCLTFTFHISDALESNSI